MLGHFSILFFKGLTHFVLAFQLFSMLFSILQQLTGRLQSTEIKRSICTTQPAFTCSKSPMETLEQCVKFHTLFWCFHIWLWTGFIASNVCIEFKIALKKSPFLQNIANQYPRYEAYGFNQMLSGKPLSICEMEQYEQIWIWS